MEETCRCSDLFIRCGDCGKTFPETITQAQRDAAVADARKAALEEAASALESRADEWRLTARELSAKGAPTEIRNHAHDMKDEAHRWAKHIRALIDNTGGGNG
jgi:hypothetical protein